MSPLETRELAYFVAVAEVLHFGQAAERLSISQPSLSRAISRLERRVGVPLLDRTTRRVALTPAGAVFLTECRLILAAVDSAINVTRRAAEQRVTLASRPATGPGVLPVLLTMGGERPQPLRTDLLFTYDEAAALHDGTADLALMCQSSTQRGMEFTELGLEHPVVLLPSQHALAGHPFVTLAELEGLPGWSPEVPHEGLDAMVDRVALGQLVVVVGESVSDRLGGAVTAVPVHDYPITRLVLAWLPGARPAVEQFTALALETIGSTIHRGLAEGARAEHQLVKSHASLGRSRRPHGSPGVRPAREPRR